MTDSLGDAREQRLNAAIAEFLAGAATFTPHEREAFVEPLVATGGAEETKLSNVASQ